MKSARSAMLNQKIDRTDLARQCEESFFLKCKLPTWLFFTFVITNTHQTVYSLVTKRTHFSFFSLLPLISHTWRNRTCVMADAFLNVSHSVAIRFHLNKRNKERITRRDNRSSFLLVRSVKNYIINTCQVRCSYFCITNSHIIFTNRLLTVRNEFPFFYKS